MTLVPKRDLSHHTVVIWKLSGSLSYADLTNAFTFIIQHQKSYLLISLLISSKTLNVRKTFKLTIMGTSFFQNPNFIYLVI